MYSKVKRLRRNGARLSDSEIGRDPGVFGELRSNSYSASGRTHVRLYEWGGALAKTLIPDLINARGAAVGNNRMLLEGLESADGKELSSTVLQEWAIEWLGHPGDERPAAYLKEGWSKIGEDHTAARAAEHEK